jgi:hypothetical protein
MMFRVFFLFFLTFFACLVSLKTLPAQDGMTFVPIGCFLLGLFLISRTIASYIRFKLEANQVVIEKAFQSATCIDLNQLVGWRELSYPIRGQRRRTLILLLPHDKELVLSNRDLKEEFDELHQFLQKNYSSIEIH